MFKLSVILAAFAFFGRSVKSFDSEYSLETRYIEVPLDHLETTTPSKSFKLRFLITEKYHVKGGPVFITTGNEVGDINKCAQNTGFLFDIAPTFNALLIFVEHRYYGQSLPFGNESFSSPENLRYLTTTQALADYAFVIDTLKKTSYETNPFIAFGGSYGGMLATWLRMKYPFLVMGAVVSSAPIGMASCDCIYKTVTQVFKEHGSQQCVKTIKLSWDVIINLSKSKLGMELISSSWRLCGRLTLEDSENLLSWLSNVYINLVMGNYHYPTDIFTPLPAYPVRAFCDKITTSYVNDTKGFIEQFGHALEIYTNYTGNQKCNNINSYPEDLNEIAWDYQKCTELIMPKCSTENDMFITRPWDYEQYAMECYKKYNVRSHNSDWKVIYYGGKNLVSYSNIVFGYGMMDPYSCEGVFGNAPANVYSVNITDAPHLLDLMSRDLADSDYISEVRKFYVQVLNQWLREPFTY